MTQALAGVVFVPKAGRGATAEQEQHADAGGEYDKDFAQRIVAAVAAEYRRDDIRDVHVLRRIFEIPRRNVDLGRRVGVAEPRLVEGGVYHDQCGGDDDREREYPPRGRLAFPLRRERKRAQEQDCRNAGANRRFGQRDVGGVQHEEVGRDQQAGDAQQHDGNEQITSAHDSDRGDHEQGQQEDAKQGRHDGSSGLSGDDATGSVPASNAALASAFDAVGLVSNRNNRIAASLIVASDNPA